MNSERLQNFKTLRTGTGRVQYLGGQNRKIPGLAGAFLSFYHMIQDSDFQERLMMAQLSVSSLDPRATLVLVLPGG